LLLSLRINGEEVEEEEVAIVGVAVNGRVITIAGTREGKDGLGEPCGEFLVLRVVGDRERVCFPRRDATGVEVVSEEGQGVDWDLRGSLMGAGGSGLVAGVVVGVMNSGSGLVAGG